MSFFRSVNNSNSTFKLHELILQCLENIQEFFQVDRISNCVLRDRKNICVLRGLIALLYSPIFSLKFIMIIE